MKSVLITGATSGIGYELAKLFYKEDYLLILVGRSHEKLDDVSKKLKNSQTAQEIILICEDLSEVGAAKRIYEKVKQRKVELDLLINNAGAGYVGEFVKEDEAQILQHIHLNIVTLTLLTRYFAADMKTRGKGKILNVASTGSYHPGPYTSVYYATKSYVLSLTEALYEELRGTGVQIASLCPGATKTNFAAAAGRENSSIAMSAESVAKKAFMGLEKNKKHIVPGIRNKLWILLPKWVAVPFIKKYQKGLLKS